MEKEHKAIWEREYIKSILVARESFKMQNTLPPIEEDETELMADEKPAERNVSRNLSKEFMNLTVTKYSDDEPTSDVDSPVYAKPMKTTNSRVVMMGWPTVANGKRICTENKAAIRWDRENVSSSTSSSDEMQLDLECAPMRRRRHRSSNSI